MYDICCIGHITLDKVVTPHSEVFMAGGTSFYFSNAISNIDVSYLLVTSLAKSEMHFVDDLRKKKINIEPALSQHTVYFENIYSHNQDHRTQRVLQTADAFTKDQVSNSMAKIFHLGPLLSNDISTDIIQLLSLKGKVSLDVQGYLRKVEDQQVIAIDWADKIKALPYIDILKANESEMEVLTGSSDVYKAAEMLHNWGVKEVVITLGSLGSVIFFDGVFYEIPAYIPSAVVDATGCGDTYMAGYLYQRVKGKGIQEAGEFAAAMASLKIAGAGPFTGTEDDVLNLLDTIKVK